MPGTSGVYSIYPVKKDKVKDGTPAKWKHPDVPGTYGVYPVKKDKVIQNPDGTSLKTKTNR